MWARYYDPIIVRYVVSQLIWPFVCLKTWPDRYTPNVRCLSIAVSRLSE